MDGQMGTIGRTGERYTKLRSADSVARNCCVLIVLCVSTILVVDY